MVIIKMPWALGTAAAGKGDCRQEKSLGAQEAGKEAGGSA